MAKLNNIMLYDVIKLLSKYPLPPKSKRWYVQTKDTVHQKVIFILEYKNILFVQEVLKKIIPVGLI